MGESVTRPLFHVGVHPTIQQYTHPPIPGVTIRQLATHPDDSGDFVELAQVWSTSTEEVSVENPPNCDYPGFNLRQINYSLLLPGRVKAYHIHPTQTDIWFVPPQDRCLVVLFDARPTAPHDPWHVQRFVMGAGRAVQVSIPPGVAHGIKNLGDHPSSLIYFVDRQFTPDPAACEEGRLPWTFLGKEIWEPRNE